MIDVYYTSLAELDMVLKIQEAHSLIYLSNFWKPFNFVLLHCISIILMPNFQFLHLQIYSLNYVFKSIS
jgi:hypothetical protein